MDRLQGSHPAQTCQLVQRLLRRKQRPQSPKIDDQLFQVAQHPMSLGEEPSGAAPRWTKLRDVVLLVGVARLCHHLGLAASLHAMLDSPRALHVSLQRSTIAAVRAMERDIDMCLLKYLVNPSTSRWHVQQSR